jgi:phosphoenolpyruvate synthase/pyruvate phosphate dikinase
MTGAASIVRVDGVDPASTRTADVGTKMGRLAQLHRLGVLVPRGFTVTTAAYRRHRARSGLDARIEEAFAELGTDPGEDALGAAAVRLRDAVERTPLSDDLAAEIIQAYAELCRRCHEIDIPTAVRSSAAGEDGATASFAGIFDTCLGVSGAPGVLAAVRSCWGSLFTTRAMAYRVQSGIGHRDVPSGMSIAVGVTELVPARASGVAFSVHPVSGKPDRVVIEASWGFGEAVGQGRVTPDHAEVGKSDGRLLSYDVAHKGVMSAYDAAGGQVVEIGMPAGLADRRVLDDEQIAAVTAVVTSIERHVGLPVDVEWVLPRHRRAGDPICVVQARPVTVPVVGEPAQTGYDPVEMARKHVFSRSRAAPTGRVRTPEPPQGAGAGNATYGPPTTRRREP